LPPGIYLAYNLLQIKRYATNFEYLVLIFCKLATHSFAVGVSLSKRSPDYQYGLKMEASVIESLPENARIFIEMDF
jgi:hypothetical protein